MSLFSYKLTGPACCVTGVVMLAVQAYVYVDVGLLSSWLIGGGIGLLVAGAATWFYYLDDNRSGGQLASDDELPTADEFERHLQEVDPDDADTNRPTSRAR